MLAAGWLFGTPTVASECLALTCYLSDSVRTVARSSSRPGLRSSNTAVYVKPRCRTKFGERGFSHAGPTVWNSLPHHLHRISDTGLCKRRLKTRQDVCTGCRTDFRSSRWVGFCFAFDHRWRLGFPGHRQRHGWWGWSHLAPTRRPRHRRRSCEMMHVHLEKPVRSTQTASPTPRYQLRLKPESAGWTARAAAAASKLSN